MTFVSVISKTVIRLIRQAHYKTLVSASLWPSSLCVDVFLFLVLFIVFFVFFCFFYIYGWCP
jgi:preprotein translocase subunit SecY